MLASEYSVIYLSQAADCFIANVSYMSNTIAFSEYASDASDCHAKCKSFGEICAAFTYINEACTGFSSTSIPSMMLPGAISGANTCGSHILFWLCFTTRRLYIVPWSYFFHYIFSSRRHSDRLRLCTRGVHVQFQMEFGGGWQNVFPPWKNNLSIHWVS